MLTWPRPWYGFSLAHLSPAETLAAAEDKDPNTKQGRSARPILQRGIGAVKKARRTRLVNDSFHRIQGCRLLARNVKSLRYTFRQQHPNDAGDNNAAGADCRSAAIRRRHGQKGLASVRARRDHDLLRLPLLVLIAAPFSPRLSRDTSERHGHVKRTKRYSFVCSRAPRSAPK